MQKTQRVCRAMTYIKSGLRKSVSKIVAEYQIDIFWDAFDAHGGGLLSLCLYDLFEAPVVAS